MAEHKDPITVLLFRCGRSQWLDDGRLRGSTDLPLSAEGRASMLRDLEEVGDLKISQISHPADEAAAETAAAIAERWGGKPRAVPGLSDPDLGLLEGLSSGEFSDRYRTRYKRWMNDPLSLSPPEGESVAAARQRIFQTVARLLRKVKNGGAALVLHDYGLGLLECSLQNRPASDLWDVLKDHPLLVRYDVSAEQIDRLEQVEQPAREQSVPKQSAA